jgi:hypothetical protein
MTMYATCRNAARRAYSVSLLVCSAVGINGDPFPQHCEPVGLSTEAILFAVLCELNVRRVLKTAKSHFRFVMSVCPSVRTHGTTRLPLDGFHES